MSQICPPRIGQTLFRAATVAGVLLLGGCALFSGQTPPPCPTGGPLVDAASVTHFSSGHVAGNIIVQGEMGAYGLACKVRDGQVEVRFDLTVLGERGPKGPDLKYFDFPYFIAILNPQEEILQRQAFSSRVTFDNTGAAGMTPSVERHSLTFALPEGDSAGRYKIITGFDLSPDALEYNRQRLRGAALKQD